MKLTSALFKAARLSATIRSASRGPGPLARRLISRPVYAKANGLIARGLNKIFKPFGL